jgi:hypothetical protein
MAETAIAGNINNLRNIRHIYCRILQACFFESFHPQQAAVTQAASNAIFVRIIAAVGQ